MINSRHKKLYEHYTKYFKQTPVFSLQLKKELMQDGKGPITTFVFRPTKVLPFWKLCTIGASDYLMPERDIGSGRHANRRNEYVMFLSPEIKVSRSSAD